MPCQKSQTLPPNFHFSFLSLSPSSLWALASIVKKREDPYGGLGKVIECLRALLLQKINTSNQLSTQLRMLTCMLHLYTKQIDCIILLKLYVGFELCVWECLLRNSYLIKTTGLRLESFFKIYSRFLKVGSKRKDWPSSSSKNGRRETQREISISKSETGRRLGTYKHPAG